MRTALASCVIVQVYEPLAGIVREVKAMIHVTAACEL
jgi:hypothetical protein